MNGAAVLLTFVLGLLGLAVATVFVTWVAWETCTYLRLRDERDAKVRSGGDRPPG